MDLTIVAVYTICDDLLISLGHQDHPLAKMDVPEGSKVYADKAYCSYGVEDALQAAGIFLKSVRKKNSKRQYPPWEVYLQQLARKRVEVTISLIEQLFPKSIHAVSAPGFELKVFLFVIATRIKQLFG